MQLDHILVVHHEQWSSALWEEDIALWDASQGAHVPCQLAPICLGVLVKSAWDSRNAPKFALCGPALQHPLSTDCGLDTLVRRLDATEECAAPKDGKELKHRLRPRRRGATPEGVVERAF